MASDRLTLTVEEAAARLGISRTLAYELVRRLTYLASYVADVLPP